MQLGFIGQEVSATITTTAQQSPSTASAAADLQTGAPTYVPVDKFVSEADAAHNTILVGLLIALVAVSVALGGLAIYCLRRRAQRRLARDYQAELQAVQRKKDEDEAARGA